MTLSQVVLKISFVLAMLMFGFSFSIPTSHAAERIESYISEADLNKLANPGDGPVNISISTAGRDYDLVLTESSALNDFSTESRHFFGGKVIQDDFSWVRISYDNNKLSGHIKAWDELLEIEHTFSGNTARISLKSLSSIARTHAHHVHDETLNAPFSETTGTTDHALSHEIENLIRSSRAKSTALPVTRVLRLSIVIDSRFNETYGGKGLSKALSTINSVDGLFQEQFGLAIQLESTTLLTAENDPFLSFDGSIETVLREFRAYTLDNTEISKNAGVLHLFTGSYDANKIIGLSWINTVCRTDGYNVSVSSPFAQQMLLAAHEIGHNLGAVHDDSSSCEVEQNKVMWPNISDSTTSNFSDCSKQAILPKMSSSCNLDNIDMALEITKTSQSLSSNSHTIEIRALNTNPTKRASRVSSVTVLPDDVIPVSIPNRCNYFANTLTCNHGNIDGGSSDALTINVEAQEESLKGIEGELKLTDFADINRLNNYASFNSSDSSANNNSNSGNENPDAGNATDSGSGAGSTSVLVLSALLLFFIARLYADISHGRQITTNKPTPRRNLARA